MTNILAQTSRGRPGARRRPRRACAGGRYLVVRSPRGRGWWSTGHLRSHRPSGGGRCRRSRARHTRQPQRQRFAIRRRPARRQPMRRNVRRRASRNPSGWNRSITRSTRSSVHEPAKAPMRPPAPWFETTGGRRRRVPTEGQSRRLRRWHENRGSVRPAAFRETGTRVPRATESLESVSRHSSLPGR